MPDNLLNAALEGEDPAQVMENAQAEPDPSGRPPGLPDKFWDEKHKAVRLDAMIRSYADLEKKLGSVSHREVPPSPDDYDINLRDEILAVDAEVNKKLHAAGFSREQAQVVYDLAYDHLLPLLADLAAQLEADSQVQRLEQRFGGRERWREVARQISAWGSTHLPVQVFEALSTTPEGIETMHQMMAAAEPGLIRERGTSDGIDEAEMKSLMRDPRYWRDQDPTIVERVRAGFRALYPAQR
jgi:hypothetical protein